ncbi:MAG: type III-B CRISPR module-associated protein Cmr3 [Sulfolobales archaeon]|nr:type III-B CRISPR module-associated protein Cmr3 [Sulfolobales archaeon]
MFIIIRPLKPVSFRWGGEFSPTLSGPMNKGVSEPLPLPSTIAGFIYSITHGGGKREDLTELSLEKESVKAKLWARCFTTKVNITPTVTRAN